jgi:N-acylneuraminate cytidylyltransferase
VANPEFVMKSKGIFEGKVGLIQVPDDRAIDIDTPFDFEVAEYLLSKKGG